MKKVMFTCNEKVAQGDGNGALFEKGKAYWLRDDSVEYWRSIDAIVDAPADMPTENEQPAPVLRPEHVRIRRVRGGKYHVYGPDEFRFTEEPLDAPAAERLRQKILSGEVAPASAAPAAPAVAPGETSQSDGDVAPVELRQVEKDGARLVFATRDWPKRSLFACEILTAPPPCVSVSGDQVTIDVQNGIAVYQLGASDVNGRRFGDLIEGTFEPAPE